MQDLTLEKACELLESSSEDLSWTPATLSRIETGQQNTKLDRLEALANLYNVSVPELFEYDGTNELLKLAWNVPPERVSLAVDLLKTLISHQDFEAIAS